MRRGAKLVCEATVKRTGMPCENAVQFLGPKGEALCGTHVPRRFGEGLGTNPPLAEGWTPYRHGSR